MPYYFVNLRDFIAGAKYATKENTEQYFKAFEKCDVGAVKGTDYLGMLSKTLRKLWRKSPFTKNQEMWDVLKRH